MKKLYSFLVASIIATGAFAQGYDLQMYMVTPASGTTVPGSAATSVDFTVVNNGPDAILTGDTVWFAYSDASLNVYSLSNVAGQASGFILASDLASGGSLSATTDLGGPFSFDLSSFPDGEQITVICLGAGMDALTQTGDAEETNPTNNSDFFFISQSSGLEEATSNFAVYPVPAVNELNVKSDDEVMNITIVGLDGKVLASAANTNTINVANIPTGAYVYVVETANGTVVRNKFIKK